MVLNWPERKLYFYRSRPVGGWGWDQLCWSFRTLAVCIKNISCFICHLFKNLFCPFHSPNYNIWAIPIFVFPCHQLESITKGCYKIGITEKRKKKRKSVVVISSLPLYLQREGIILWYKINAEHLILNVNSIRVHSTRSINV